MSGRELILKVKAMATGSGFADTQKKLSGLGDFAKKAGLMVAGGMLAGTLASIHNLYFIINLVKKIRQSILLDHFFEFKKEFLEEYLK